jgi:methionyl aminopeptidase
MRYDIKLKSGKDLEHLRESAKRLSVVLSKAAAFAAPGISTSEIDQYVRKLIEEGGDTPAFLNYKPFGAAYPYPGSICLSVNNEVVHGIGGDYVLTNGDLLSLDGGIKHKGMISDSALTIPIGTITEEEKELLMVTERALYAGIDVIKPGKHVNDISKAIEKSIPKKYGIVKILSGHGVGYKVHEEPYVPNYDDGVKGPKLVPGMVLAIEPMVNFGTDDVILLDDGYTFVTADGKKSAHFEHTVLVTEEGYEVLTERA